jgi:hypothetical protein
MTLEVWKSGVNAHSLLAEKIDQQRRRPVLFGIALAVFPHAINVGVEEV